MRVLLCAAISIGITSQGIHPLRDARPQYASLCQSLANDALSVGSKRNKYKSVASMLSLVEAASYHAVAA